MDQLERSRVEQVESDAAHAKHMDPDGKTWRSRRDVCATPRLPGISPIENPSCAMRVEMSISSLNISEAPYLCCHCGAEAHVE